MVSTLVHFDLQHVCGGMKLFYNNLSDFMVLAFLVVNLLIFFV